MEYKIILPLHIREELRRHLLGDRTREQMAIVLCGVHERGDELRLLGRHCVLMPPEAFSHQSAGGLALSPTVQQHVLQLAARERLSQVDFHTHPGEGPHVGFSGIDDHNEQNLARYLHERLPGTVYGSVVLNTQAASARVWERWHRRVMPVSIAAPDLASESVLSFINSEMVNVGGGDERFDRQVRAFGPDLQHRLSRLRAGIVGVGGLGSMVVEQLARLGVRDWVLADPDVVEVTNLNRLVGASVHDVQEECGKVDVAARNIRCIEPEAHITALRCSVFTERALKAFKDCDLLIGTTDNDASRLTLNALACQYLIPVVHAGVNLEPGRNGAFEDISGEVAIPSLGSWCLLCGGIIDAERASWDRARPEERRLLVQRGYLADVPAPAVNHLNGVVASLAVAEIHNLISPYKPRRKYLVYGELQSELMSINVPHTDNCMHCNPEGLLGLGDLVPIKNEVQRRFTLGGGLPSADSALAETTQEL